MGKNIKYVVWIVVAIVVGGLAFALFRPADEGGRGVQDVDAARMSELVAQGVRVIDVRTGGEFEGGRIPGAENVPMDQLESASQSWDRTQPVAVYCATGSRSSSAVQYLEQQGFETIYHFANGIASWNGETERGTAIVEVR
jgi:rhodanese-related sulfurtransferase